MKLLEVRAQARAFCIQCVTKGVPQLCLNPALPPTLFQRLYSLSNRSKWEEKTSSLECCVYKDQELVKMQAVWPSVTTELQELGLNSCAPPNQAQRMLLLSQWFLLLSNPEPFQLLLSFSIGNKFRRGLITCLAANENGPLKLRSVKSHRCVN